MSSIIAARTWPSTPDRVPDVGTGVASVWADFKLTSASWYIDTLQQLDESIGMDRYIGVEMAIDGALASLNGAWDSIRSAGIDAAEAMLLPAERINPWMHQDDDLTYYVRQLQRAGMLPTDKSDAVLKGQAQATSTDPQGWLIELKRLRNQSVHTDTLPRTVHIGVQRETTYRHELRIGDRNEAVVDYLRRAYIQVEELVRAVSNVIRHLFVAGIILDAQPDTPRGPPDRRLRKAAESSDPMSPTVGAQPPDRPN